ncbi:hypothetical protein NL676_002288 [Syzygium grande]|nr:hypothetical protein NL676_002288 [Syzygium grande]
MRSPSKAIAASLVVNEATKAIARSRARGQGDYAISGCDALPVAAQIWRWPSWPCPLPRRPSKAIVASLTVGEATKAVARYGCNALPAAAQIW